MSQTLKRLGAGLLLATAAGLLYLRFAPAERPAQRVERKPSAELTRLARDRTPASRAALLARYGARPDDRRAIANEILATEEPRMAIELLVAAVSQDKTPLAEDDMLDHL